MRLSQVQIVMYYPLYFLVKNQEISESSILMIYHQTSRFLCSGSACARWSAKDFELHYVRTLLTLSKHRIVMNKSATPPPNLFVNKQSNSIGLETSGLERYMRETREICWFDYLPDINTLSRVVNHHNFIFCLMRLAFITLIWLNKIIWFLHCVPAFQF